MTKIDDLVAGPWDALALYHLTPEQAKELLAHKGVTVEEGWLPAHYRFPEHAHHEPQLLLVKRGTLSHTSAKMHYPQKENDLLVVPANVKHTALVGDEQLEFFLILRR
jgi:quercetin dioxygenase-like cupin family protein